MALKPVKGKIESQELNDNFSYLDSISNNPLGAMQINGQKIPLSMLSNDVIEAMTGNTEITNASGYFENNRGVDYPLRNASLEGEVANITDLARDAILDVKVFGAKMDCYYRLVFVGNGYVSAGEEQWGITVHEYPVETYNTTGEYNIVFYYTNTGKWKKRSDGIDTITLDNGDIAVSVTVDREIISQRVSTGFLNLNIHAETAIIDPSNYFF